MMRKLILLLIINVITFTNQENIQFPHDNPESMIFNQTGPQTFNRISEDAVNSVVVDGISQFALSLNKFLINEGNIDAIVFSPVNIAAALSLLLLGSNGKTFNEIAHVLGYSSGIDLEKNSHMLHEHIGGLFKKLEQTATHSNDIEVNMASGIFIQNDFSIRSIYKDLSERIYKSETLNLDFKLNPEHAKDTINAWVSDRTKSKIKNIIPETLPAYTKLVLATALYYNAAWEIPFISELTKPLPFHPNGRDSNDVRMINMMLHAGSFPYYKDSILDCEIIGLPYKNNKNVMYVVLPNNSNKDKLKEFESRLTASDLNRLIDNTVTTKLIIAFPKMRLETSLDLKVALMNLGIKSLFEPSESNLALISPGITGTFRPSMNPGLISNTINNPISANVQNDEGNVQNDEGVLIFSRSGVPINCTEIFDPDSNITKCDEIDEDTNKQVTYKKFGDKVGRRIQRDIKMFNAGSKQIKPHFQQNLDSLRHTIQPNENPGLYADKIYHKVFMDINEVGTEAAAATAATLGRSGVTIFRANTPFLFFIRNTETKLILFWGSVFVPPSN